MSAAPDNHTERPHRHLDHVYVSLFTREDRPAETLVTWLTERQVRDWPGLSEDSRRQVLTVFPLIDDLTRDLHVTDAGDAWLAPGSLQAALDDLARERAAQDALWGRQEFPDGIGDPSFTAEADRAKAQVTAAWQLGELTWRHVLAEEFWEALAESDPTALRTELVQTAAVAVKWIQSLDRRHGRPDHQVKTSGGRTERLSRDHEAADRRPHRNASTGELAGLLMVKAYEDLGRVIADWEPAALLDLLEVLHTLAPSCGLESATLEEQRSRLARERGGYGAGVILDDAS